MMEDGRGDECGGEGEEIGVGMLMMRFIVIG